MSSTATHFAADAGSDRICEPPRPVAIIPGDDPALWRDLGGHPSGSLFASCPWIEAVSRTYGFDVAASARESCGRYDAAIVFSHVRDFRGERIVCFPFSDFSDPFADDIAAWREVVAPLLAHGVPIQLRCLRNSSPAGDERFRLTRRAAWHATDLDRTEEDIWLTLSGKARTPIRKAQTDGLRVRESRSLDDLRTFYDMHCHVRKAKYRLLAQPFAFLENLHRAFSENDQLTVFLAEKAGTPVAGSVFISWGDTLYYKFNASVGRDYGVNELILWVAMQAARSRGLRLLDFGASDLDQPGLIAFKRKFASEEREIQQFRWEPPGYANARGLEAGALLGGITHLLTDPAVPDGITRAGGDLLYAQFC